MIRSVDEVWIDSENHVFYIAPSDKEGMSRAIFLNGVDLSVFSPDKLSLRQTLPDGKELLKIPNGSDIYLTRNKHGRPDNFDTCEVLQRFFSVKRLEWSMQDIAVSYPSSSICVMVVEFQFWNMD